MSVTSCCHVVITCRVGLPLKPSPLHVLFLSLRQSACRHLAMIFHAAEAWSYWSTRQRFSARPSVRPPARPLSRPTGGPASPRTRQWPVRRPRFTATTHPSHRRRETKSARLLWRRRRWWPCKCSYPIVMCTSVTEFFHWWETDRSLEDSHVFHPSRSQYL